VQLAEKKPELSVKVIAVFIARSVECKTRAFVLSHCSEENSSIPGVGVDELMEVCMCAM
jgi:hypothetical protein